MEIEEVLEARIQPSGACSSQLAKYGKFYIYVSVAASTTAIRPLLLLQPVWVVMAPEW